MNKMSFFKGIGVGVMVGSIAGMTMAPKKNSARIGKALRSIGSAVDSVAGALGL